MGNGLARLRPDVDAGQEVRGQLHPLPTTKIGILSTEKAFVKVLLLVPEFMNLREMLHCL
jgi:hypothetical protein